jgi:tetratricopeptide (TPR) repeat protein
MRSHLGLALLLVLSTLAVHPLPVQAETAADRRAAAVHFRRASQLYRLGQFEEALEQFRSSLARASRPSTILNIAQCYRQLDKTEQALFYYRLYLAEFDKKKPGQRSPHHDEVDEHIRRLSAALTRGRAPATKPAPASTTAQREESRPSVAAATPPAPTAPARRRRVWTWVTGAAAVVAAGVGLGLGLSANSGYDEFQSTTDPARYDELKESVPRRGHAATAMFSVAGALAVTSVVLFFVEGRPSSERRSTSAAGVKVRPMAGEAWGLSLHRSY